MAQFVARLTWTGGEHYNLYSLREELYSAFLPSAVEPYQSFKMVPGEKRPRLVYARRKCLTFYFLDPQLGMRMC